MASFEPAYLPKEFRDIEFAATRLTIEPETQPAEQNEEDETEETIPVFQQASILKRSQ